MERPADLARWALLCSAALSGAGVMMIELSATRALAPVFGSSHYTWTNVIAVILVGLAMGYALGGAWADRGLGSGALARILGIAALATIPAAFGSVTVAQWFMPPPAATTVFDATGHVIRGSLVTALILFCPAAMLLGMVAPFVTRGLVDRGWEPGRAAGRTLAVSTLGSLVGTYLPAHVLLPSLGVRATFLCAAGVLATAGVLAASARRDRIVAAVLAVGLLAAAASVGPGTVRGLLIDRELANPAEAREVTLTSEHDSPYQYVRVSEWQIGSEQSGHRELRLALDEGVLEFHSVKALGATGGPHRTGYYYDHLAVLPDLIAGSAPIRAVVLGGGAGTLAALLRDFHGTRLESVTSVEIDPVVAALGPRFGHVSNLPDVDVVADARVFLATHAGPYDLLVLDAYARQIAIPSHLATREFFELVSARLSPRGIFAANISTSDLESPLLQSLMATLAESFPALALVSVRASWNVLLIATKEPLTERPRIQPLGDALDSARREFRRGLLTTPPRRPAPILTDDRAPLDELARSR